MDPIDCLKLFYDNQVDMAMITNGPKPTALPKRVWAYSSSCICGYFRIFWINTFGRGSKTAKESRNKWKAIRLHPSTTNAVENNQQFK